MTTSKTDKLKIKSDITESLSREPEVEKIVLFGSFLKNDIPHDIDIAVFQSSNKDYLTLALKYRKLLRAISAHLPIDIIPLKNDSPDSFTISEINNGEIIFERRN